MARPKGSPKLGGRKKGTPNKMSATVKENILAVFDGLGGVNGMLQWAGSSDENMGKFYAFYSKLLPTDITSDGKQLDTRTVIERLIVNA